jgi:hypothetical protein
MGWPLFVCSRSPREKMRTKQENMLVMRTNQVHDARVFQVADMMCRCGNRPGQRYEHLDAIIGKLGNTLPRMAAVANNRAGYGQCPVAMQEGELIWPES